VNTIDCSVASTGRSEYLGTGRSEPIPVDRPRYVSEDRIARRPASYPLQEIFSGRESEQPGIESDQRSLQALAGRLGL
jgi:hypothetical protein